MGTSMSLQIEQREQEGIVILGLKGRLTVGDASTILRDKILALAAAGSKEIILDLANVDYIDSTGLGTMVVCFTTLRKAGGHLKLENLTRRNVELIVLTKLETVFEIFDDEHQAVNSFFPNREIKRFDILSFIQEQQKEQAG
jgi:anti-sigma B factor antagonist